MSFLTNTCQTKPTRTRPQKMTAAPSSKMTLTSSVRIPCNGGPHVLETRTQPPSFWRFPSLRSPVILVARSPAELVASQPPKFSFISRTSDEGAASLSIVFPNRPESDSAMSRIPVLGQLRDAVLRSSTPAAPPRTTALARRKTKVSRQLTPQKVGVAWEKVRRVVRDFCRQRGPECLLCSLYGHRIEFQLTAVHRPITLDLEGDCIVARISRRRWTIHIVRIKTGGSGYELRGKILTATSMLIELLLESQR